MNPHQLKDRLDRLRVPGTAARLRQCIESIVGNDPFDNSAWLPAEGEKALAMLGTYLAGRCVMLGIHGESDPRHEQAAELLAGDWPTQLDAEAVDLVRRITALLQ